MKQYFEEILKTFLLFWSYGLDSIKDLLILYKISIKLFLSVLHIVFQL